MPEVGPPPNSVLLPGLLPFAIPELLDHIIDHLSSCTADLLSCSLVSKSWVPRAQFNLFWEIDMVKHNCPEPEIGDRLMKRLEIAPRLSHLIRRLSITLDRQLLEGVVRKTLPSLEEVTVHCTDRQYHTEDIKTRFLVQSILRQPTIRRVTLSGLFNSISAINTYFDNCSPNIYSLDVYDVYADPSDEFESKNSSPTSPLPSKIYLSHLSPPLYLDEAPPLLAWMIHPQCPFAFSRLESIQIGDGQWPFFYSALTQSPPTIKHLKLTEFSGDHKVDQDLNVLLALRSLEVHIVYRERLSRFLAMLRRLPSDISLDTMRLLVLWPVAAKDCDILRDFDASITTMNIYRSLRRVEIHAECLEQDISTTMSFFPSLTSAGKLLIHPPTLRGTQTEFGSEEGYSL
ncbi:hypothetical protein C8R47DRAFT_1065887 [Mycena vitilis]|nr:hypothetical protein C8R47DRAFT_1065887 [Mycena vitilis]